MKSRGFTGVLYEDSCNPKWREELEQLHIQYFYAKHDKDINPDGTKKEPHIHVAFIFDGPTTQKNGEDIGKLLGVKNGIVQPIKSIRGVYRYFTHKDNPEKYQYDESVLVTGGGFNVENIQELTAKEIREYKRDIIGIIKDNNIMSYGELIDVLIQSEDINMFQVASTNTLFFNTYINSKKYIKNN